MLSRLAEAGFVFAMIMFGSFAAAPVVMADSGGVVLDPSGPLLSLDLLAPGVSGSGTLGVTNDSSEPARLYLRVVNLRNDDNGCNYPERVVDFTCDDGEGELAQTLQLTLISDPGPGPRVHWSGTPLQLADGIAAHGVLPPRKRVPITITAALPTESGNETQSDSVTFDLRVTLSGVMGDRSTEVRGIKIGRDNPGAGDAGSGSRSDELHDGVRVRGIKLARTGAEVLALLVLGGGAVAVGGALIAGGRRGTSDHRR